MNLGILSEYIKSQLIGAIYVKTRTSRQIPYSHENSLHSIKINVKKKKEQLSFLNVLAIRF